MREIKFRAKRVDNGEWVLGGYSYCEKDNTYYITVMGKDHISHIGFHQQVNPETIGQFTGLYDKNGKEIYEGDIVKFKHDAMGEWIGDVFWDENERGWNAHLRYLGKGEPLFVLAGEIIGLGYSNEMYEVISNIYENPELIGG